MTERDFISKIILDTDAARKDLESLMKSVKSLTDMLNKAGKNKVDFDIDPGAAKKAKSELDQVLGTTKKLTQSLNEVIATKKRMMTLTEETGQNFKQGIGVANASIKELKSQLNDAISELRAFSDIKPGKQTEYYNTLTKALTSLQSTIQESSRDMRNLVVDSNKLSSSLSKSVSLLKTQQPGTPAFKKTEADIESLIQKLRSLKGKINTEMKATGVEDKQLLDSIKTIDTTINKAQQSIRDSFNKTKKAISDESVALLNLKEATKELNNAVSLLNASKAATKSGVAVDQSEIKDEIELVRKLQARLKELRLAANLPSGSGADILSAQKSERKADVALVDKTQATRIEYLQKVVKGLFSDYRKLVSETKKLEQGTKDWTSNTRDLQKIEDRIKHINNALRETYKIGKSSLQTGNLLGPGIEKLGTEPIIRLKKELSSLISEYKKLDTAAKQFKEQPEVFRMLESESERLKKSIQSITGQLAKIPGGFTSIAQAKAVIDRPFGGAGLYVQARSILQAEDAVSKLITRYNQLVQSGREVRKNIGQDSLEYRELSEQAGRARNEIRATAGILKAAKPSSIQLAKANAALSKSYEAATASSLNFIAKISRFKTVIFAATVAIFNMQRAVGGLKNVYIDTLGELKKLEIGQAGAFNNVYAENFNTSLRRSRKFIRELLKDAVKLNLNFQTLQEVSTATLPLFLQMGFDEEQSRKIIGIMTKGAETLFPSQAGFQAQSEIRALLGQGPINRAQIVQAIGFHSGADIKGLLATGPDQFTETILEKSKGFATAGEESLKTVEGIQRQISNTMLLLSETIGTQLYEATAKLLKEIENGLRDGSFDGLITSVRDFGEVAASVVGLVKPLLDIANKLSNFTPVLIGGFALLARHFDSIKNALTFEIFARKRQEISTISLTNSEVQLTNARNAENVAINTSKKSITSFANSMISAQAAISTAIVGVTSFIYAMDEFKKYSQGKDALGAVEVLASRVENINLGTFASLEQIRGKTGRDLADVSPSAREAFVKQFETSLSELEAITNQLKIIKAQTRDANVRQAIDYQINQAEQASNELLSVFGNTINEIQRGPIGRVKQLFKDFNFDAANDRVDDELKNIADQMEENKDTIEKLNEKLKKVVEETPEPERKALKEESGKIAGDIRFIDVYKSLEASGSVQPEDVKKLYDVSDKYGFVSDGPIEAEKLRQHLNSRLSDVNNTLRKQTDIENDISKNEAKNAGLKSAQLEIQMIRAQQEQESIDLYQRAARNDDEVLKFRSKYLKAVEEESRFTQEKFIHAYIDEVDASNKNIKTLEAKLKAIDSLEKNKIANFFLPQDRLAEERKKAEEAITLAKQEDPRAAAEKKYKAESPEARDLDIKTFEARQKLEQIVTKIAEDTIKSFENIEDIANDLKDSGIDPSEQEFISKRYDDIQKKAVDLSKDYSDIISLNEELSYKLKNVTTAQINNLESTEQYVERVRDKIEEQFSRIDEQAEIDRGAIDRFVYERKITSQAGTAIAEREKQGISAISTERKLGIQALQWSQTEQRISQKKDEIIRSENISEIEKLRKELDLLEKLRDGEVKSVNNLQKDLARQTAQYKAQESAVKNLAEARSDNNLKLRKEIQQISTSASYDRDISDLGNQIKEIEHAYNMGYITREKMLRAQSEIEIDIIKKQQEKEIELLQESNAAQLQIERREFNRKTEAIQKIKSLSDEEQKARAGDLEMLEADRAQLEDNINNIISKASATREGILMDAANREKQIREDLNRTIESLEREKADIIVDSANKQKQAMEAALKSMESVGASTSWGIPNVFVNAQRDINMQRIKQEPVNPYMQELVMMEYANFSRQAFAGTDPWNDPYRGKRWGWATDINENSWDVKVIKAQQKWEATKERIYDEEFKSFENGFEDMADMVSGADTIKDLDKVQKKVKKLESRLKKKEGTARYYGIDIEPLLDNAERLRDAIEDRRRYIQRAIKEAAEEERKRIAELNRQIKEELKVLRQPIDVQREYKEGLDLANEVNNLLKEGANKNLVKELVKARVKNAIQETKKQLSDLKEQFEKGYENERGELVSLNKGLKIDLKNLLEEASNRLSDIRTSYNQAALDIINEDRAVAAMTPEAERQQKLIQLSEKQRKEELGILEDTQNQAEKFRNQYKRKLKEFRENSIDLVDQLTYYMKGAKEHLGVMAKDAGIKKYLSNVNNLAPSLSTSSIKNQYKNDINFIFPGMTKSDILKTIDRGIREYNAKKART